MAGGGFGASGGLAGGGAGAGVCGLGGYRWMGVADLSLVGSSSAGDAPPEDA